MPVGFDPTRPARGLTGLETVDAPAHVEETSGAHAGETERTPMPAANVVGSVGGRALGGAVELVRVDGRDVVLPKGTTFAAYLSGLSKTGAFADEAVALSKLAATNADTADANDTRPRIGIVLSRAEMLIAGQHRNTENLIAIVERLGCRPVLIPPCADVAVTGGPQARARATAAMASSLDGLIGPGGYDVDPSIYGKENTYSVHTNVVRDRFEGDFVKVALDCDLYAFGICRSHQLWNAVTGGSLVQDVQKEGLTSVTHQATHHPIRVKPGSLLFEVTRQRALQVNSLHHQAVDFTGWGFRAVAWSDDHGTGKPMIEATERWNGITTQYHPELMQDDAGQRALFDVLGRRAHLFASIKQDKPTSMGALVQRMKDDGRYDASDVDWAKRELGRRLGLR